MFDMKVLCSNVATVLLQLRKAGIVSFDYKKTYEAIRYEMDETSSPCYNFISDNHYISVERHFDRNHLLLVVI